MVDGPIDVLLVEDNAADARLLTESLKGAGPFSFRVTHVTRLAAAVEALGRTQPEVVLLDLSLPDSTGLQTVERVQAAAPAVAVVVLTGLQDERLALESLRKGVQDYLVKGFCEGDITARSLRYAVERRRTEAALRDREARLRAVVETAADAVITIDEDGTIDSVNPATERMFGHTRDEMLGRNISIVMPEPYRSAHDGYMAAYLRTGKARIIGLGREVVGLRKDGTTFPIDLSVSEFRAGGRRMFTGIVHDISNRRRLEREVLEASANEQRRVGHELHDGLCQQLTGIAFAAEILARRLEGEAPAAVPEVRKLADEIDHAITQARTLARGLNPVEIHPDGLAAALKDLAGKVSGTYGVSCSFRREGDGDASVPDGVAATHLFRIAQEAISNAVRHGKAQNVDLRLRTGIHGGGLILSVADDGVGFSRDDVARRPHKNGGGIGLQTMVYRAKMINAILEVRPGPQRGVVVTCSVPAVPGASRPPEPGNARSGEAPHRYDAGRRSL